MTKTIETEPLGPLFSKLMGLLQRQLTGDTLRVMHERGLTLPQVFTLHTLRHAGPLTVGGLAETLQLSTSAASHLVDRLVDRGLVVRYEDRSDRRQKRVELAEHGQELLSRLGSSRVQEMEAMVARLDPEVRAALIRLLESAV